MALQCLKSAKNILHWRLKSSIHFDTYLRRYILNVTSLPVFSIGLQSYQESVTLEKRKFIYLSLFNPYFQALMSDASLEGDITVPGAPQEEDDQEFNTLDEPVKDTIVSF